MSIVLCMIWGVICGLAFEMPLALVYSFIGGLAISYLFN